MCSFGPETDVNIRSLIWRLFRDAADEDYLVARWAVQVGLEYQFAWSAQQALEKYLKCALLMNGESVLKFGHNLHGMHEKAREIAGDILPYIYIPPSEFPMNGRDGRYHMINLLTLSKTVGIQVRGIVIIA